LCIFSDSACAFSLAKIYAIVFIMLDKNIEINVIFMLGIPEYLLASVCFELFVHLYMVASDYDTSSYQNYPKMVKFLVILSRVSVHC